MNDVAPLPGTFMIMSILGFLISTLWVIDLSKTWGFTFSLVFVFMFLASFISMAKADAEEELHMDRLAFHKESVPDDVPARGTLKGMTKDELKDYAAEEFGISLSTDDLKREMIDQFFDEVQ